MTMFQSCSFILLIAVFCVSAQTPQDREWENWKDDDVAQLIHEFWLESASERDHREALAQLVKSLYLPNERFLEAGCGSGLVYQQLIPNVMGNPFYTGIDVTQNMLDIAHRDYPDGIFLWDDLYHLSFADKSFDMVAAFEVLGHLQDIEIPIREMGRVASRLIVFTVWTSDSTVVTEERFKNSRFIHTEFSHADILQAIENAMTEDYTVRTLPLNERAVAYVISLWNAPKEI